MDTPPWWTVVQAVVWIITRSLLLVERASGIRTFAAQQRLQELRPVSVGDDPPISLAAAPAELNRSIRDGSVGIYGRRGGSEPQKRVPMRGHLQAPWLANHGNEVRLDNETMLRARDYWADLWVRSDECMNRWPAPAADAASSPSISATAARSPASPTYAPDEKYSPAKIPEQFHKWAKEHHDAERIITEDMALDAMIGPKDGTGKRSGGKLAPGKHLVRKTVRAWLHSLPEDWQATRGIPPSRRRK